MFARLLKYDFRSMIKQFAFIWPAALVLAVVNRFTVSGISSASRVGETTAGFAMIVYVGIMIAMFVVTIIFTIQRFYKGLLGDEGYLMHTLPVQPWELICSKLLTAVVTTLLSIVVAVVSIIIIATNGWMPDFSDFFFVLRMGIGNWSIHATQGVLVLAELLLLVCAGMAHNYLHLYLSMAVGHLFSKNRIAMSVIAYIGINAAMGALMTLLGSIGAFAYFGGWLDQIDFFFHPTWGSVHVALWAAIASQVVIGGAFFFGTEYILHRKLNLE